MIKTRSNTFACVPTDLGTIAEDEMLNVIFDDYGKRTFDGMTMFDPVTDEFYIHINTARGNRPESTKGRFTLAHELGHYFLAHHRQALMRGTMQPHGSINYLMDNASWRIEREADEFASSLLMPEDSFRSFVRGRTFEYDVLQELSDGFNVSLSAVAIRFAEIGNHPIMVVYAIDKKVRWVKRSKDFPFWRLHYGNGNGDKVPENTVMGDYFYENDDSSSRSEELVYAKDWFDTYRQEDNEREFTEWCVPYQNRAISIIWEPK